MYDLYHCRLAANAPSPSTWALAYPRVWLNVACACPDRIPPPKHVELLLRPKQQQIQSLFWRGQTLAVDVSIWLTQFIKAMRDDDGKVMKNAHIIGTLRRVVSLVAAGCDNKQALTHSIFTKRVGSTSCVTPYLCTRIRACEEFQHMKQCEIVHASPILPPARAAALKTRDLEGSMANTMPSPNPNTRARHIPLFAYPIVQVAYLSRGAVLLGVGSRRLVPHPPVSCCVRRHLGETVVPPHPAGFRLRWRRTGAEVADSGRPTEAAVGRDGLLYAEDSPEDPGVAAQEAQGRPRAPGQINSGAPIKSKEGSHQQHASEHDVGRLRQSAGVIFRLVPIGGRSQPRCLLLLAGCPLIVPGVLRVAAPPPNSYVPYVLRNPGSFCQKAVTVARVSVRCMLMAHSTPCPPCGYIVRPE